MANSESGSVIALMSMLFSSGAVQLGGVGVALSVFGSATKLMNVPLLSVTTQIVATAVGSNEGAPTASLGACISCASPPVYHTRCLKKLHFCMMPKSRDLRFCLPTEVPRYSRMTGCSPLRKRRVIGLAASSALFIAAIVGATQVRSQPHGG